MHQFALRADGLIQNLYQLLWSKEHRSQEAQSNVQQALSDFQLNLPDTIVFKKGIPVGWYYSKKGRLFRKRKDSLTLKTIETSLTEKAKCSIICYLLEERKTVPKLAIRYMGASELKQFLAYERSQANGILQLFLPSGEHDSIYQVIWSRSCQICSIIRAKGLLAKDHLPIQYRVVNFDPFQQFQQRLPVNSQLTDVLASKIQQVCNRIQANSQGSESISKMVVYWRQVKHPKRKTAKLYLVCAVGLKSSFSLLTIHPSTQLNRLPTFVNQVTNSKNKTTPAGSIKLSLKVAKAASLQQCLRCGLKKPSCLMAKCEYQLIIKEHDRLRLLSKLGKKLQNCNDHLPEIPQIIRAECSSLTVQAYREKLKNPDFLRKEVEVCDNCYFDVTKDHPLMPDCKPTQEIVYSPGQRQYQQRAKLMILNQNRRFYQNFRKKGESVSFLSPEPNSSPRSSKGCSLQDQLLRLMRIDNKNRKLPRVNSLSVKFKL